MARARCRSPIRKRPRPMRSSMAAPWSISMLPRGRWPSIIHTPTLIATTTTTMGMIMRADLSRRRVISILAAGAALPAFARGSTADAPAPFRWRGIVLGAAADLTLYAADRAEAADALAAALAEIARLEAIFSLHQQDSALSRLNRDGRLDPAPFELQQLLSQALQLAAMSGGRFEPTIPPLWKLMAAHFAHPDADPTGPTAAAIAAVRTAVDYRGVVLDG